MRMLNVVELFIAKVPRKVFKVVTRQPFFLLPRELNFNVKIVTTKGKHQSSFEWSSVFSASYYWSRRFKVKELRETLESPWDLTIIVFWWRRVFLFICSRLWDSQPSSFFSVMKKQKFPRKTIFASELSCNLSGKRSYLRGREVM